MIRIFKYPDNEYSVGKNGKNDYAIGQAHKVVATNSLTLYPGDSVFVAFGGGSGSVGYAGICIGEYTGKNPWSNNPDQFSKSYTTDGRGSVGKTMLRDDFIKKMNYLSGKCWKRMKIFGLQRATKIEETSPEGIAILKIIPEMC